MSAGRLLAPDEWYPSGWPDVAARFVDTAGEGRVRIVEAGPPGAPHVILLHGWGASAYGFRHLLPLVAREGMHGVALDLRGHGLSDMPEDDSRYTSPAMCRHVLAVMDALHISSAVLVGQSMGGALASDIALLAPRRAAAVVMVAPIGLTSLRRIAVAQALSASWWIPGRVPRWVIAVILRRMYGTLRTFDAHDVDEYWAPSQFGDYVPALFRLVDAFDWEPRAMEALRSLGPRLRIVLGERDILVTRGPAAARAALLPDARVTTVPGAGHLVAEEAPERVMQAIRDAGAAALG